MTAPFFDTNPPAVVREVDSLDQLAAQINSTHAAGEEAAKKGIHHFRQVGAMLMRAKERCGHGRWLPWVEQNLHFGARQASKYMKLAREWERLKSELSSDLNAALRLLTEEAPEEEAETPEDEGVETPQEEPDPDPATGDDEVTGDPQDDPEPPSATEPSSGHEEEESQEAVTPPFSWKECKGLVDRLRHGTNELGEVHQDQGYEYHQALKHLQQYAGIMRRWKKRLGQQAPPVQGRPR